MRLAFKDFLFDFSKKTYLMGIINVTPDSFSDGGMFFKKNHAIKHAFKLVEDGADIIDIGGESTRPGAETISTEEELKRTIPVIEVLSERINIPISIDTYKSIVALKAIGAGATIINDISGLRFDREMANVVARFGVPVIIMHLKGTPKNMQKDPIYDDLFGGIKGYLKESISIAREAGVNEDMIIIDPGIGFGKTFDHNLQIIKDLHILKELKKPILIGTSRKAFIGNILGDVPTEERLMGTAATIAASILNGANIVRVHDVKEMYDVIRVIDSIKTA